MDQHRMVPAANGQQADRAQAQNHLDELHQLIDKLRAMKPEYQEMLIYAQKNLLDARVLLRDVESFANSLERPLISGQNLYLVGSTETSAAGV